MQRQRAICGISQSMQKTQKDIVVDADCIFFYEDGKHVRFRYRGVPFEAQVSTRFHNSCVIYNIVATDPASGLWFSVVEGPKLIKIDHSQETSRWVYYASGGKWD